MVGKQEIVNSLLTQMDFLDGYELPAHIPIHKQHSLEKCEKNNFDCKVIS